MRSVVLLGALGLVVGAWAVPRAWLTSNDVTTAGHPGYPDLRDRCYDATPDETLAAVRTIATGLPRWRVAGADAQGGFVWVVVRTAVGGFVDDLTVHVRAGTTGDKTTCVTIRSRSRVGRADLGENARHIRALQAAMDRTLSRAK